MANGIVLWFNKVKGYGAISTTDGERLHVVEPGLGPGVDPQELFNGVPVEFEVRDGANGPEAHEVAIVPTPETGGRARLRHRH